MGKNAFAKTLTDRKRVERELIMRWTSQFCLDVITLVLNDPKIMGHDVFGPKRLTKIGEAFNAEYDKWVVGLTPDVKASYTREKMDERLTRIWGEGFLKWPKRYEYWDDRGV